MTWFSFIRGFMVTVSLYSTETLSHACLKQVQKNLQSGGGSQYFSDQQHHSNLDKILWQCAPSCTLYLVVTSLLGCSAVFWTPLLFVLSSTQQTELWLLDAFQGMSFWTLLPKAEPLTWDLGLTDCLYMSCPSVSGIILQTVSLLGSQLEYHHLWTLLGDSPAPSHTYCRSYAKTLLSRNWNKATTPDLTT